MPCRKQNTCFYLKVTDFYKDQIIYYGVSHENIHAERLAKTLPALIFVMKVVANVSELSLVEPCIWVAMNNERTVYKSPPTTGKKLFT